MKKITDHPLIYTSICFAFFQLFTSSVHGQTGEMKVWVKTSPCSGRFDWITVAKENPTGASFYYLADFIFPGTACTTFGCTFQEAMTVANSLRTSSEFFKYCCRDYSVWQNTQSGQMSVVLGRFGTAGLGWIFVKGDLCCEEAEALAGIPGACSGTTANQQAVNSTVCWPGSYAAWNDQAQRVECYCKQGLIWNNTRTACVTPEVQNIDCSMYPGSYAAWNVQTNRAECWCPEGKVWNSTQTACIDNAPQVTCWPGSYAAWNTQTNRTECFCNPGLVWNNTKTACIEQVTLSTDCSGYPGSYAAWNTQTQRMECWCPEGKVWNSTQTACIDNTPQVTCWPGSYAAWNPQTNRTECYCNQGLVWNSTQTACIQPVQNPANINITEIVVTQQNVTISVWDHGCEDGDIIHLLINGVSYLTNHTLTNAKKEFNVTLNTGTNYLEIVAVDSGTDCPAQQDRTKTRNSAAIHITNATKGGDQSWELSMGDRTGANFIVRP